jgi:hypothetical protein
MSGAESIRDVQDFASLSRSSRACRTGREAYCHYDTQNTKEQNFLQPETTFTTHHQYKITRIHHIKVMSERNSQTPSTRQTPFEARLKKALRLSSVPFVQRNKVGIIFAQDGVP